MSEPRGPPGYLGVDTVHLDDVKGDALRSPLHRLQAEIAKDKSYPIEQSQTADASRAKDVRAAADTESIYSFDSVSTSGRLLDRLDIGPDGLDETWSRRRDSAFLVQSTGRLLDRLGLDDCVPENAPALGLLPSNSLSSTLTVDTRRVSIRGRSTLAVNRLPSNKLRSARAGVVNEHACTRSLSSLHGDIALASSLPVTLDSTGVVFCPPPRSSGLLDALRDIHVDRTAASSGSPHSASTGDTTVRIHSPSNTCAISGNSAGFNSTGLPQTSLTATDCEHIVFNPAPLFEPQIEGNLKKAVALRLEGKHREASYQLQILANTPVNYPKAMYLYAQALYMGQGVKRNYLSSVRTLCRCIMVCNKLEISPPKDTSELTSYILQLSELTPEKMISIINHSISKKENDPYLLYDQFKATPQAVLTKIQLVNSKDNNVLGSAYYAVANALLQGQSLAKDEETARRFLAKSAAAGYSKAMVTLGELWCFKSKSFKKDLYLAAAWLRLGELFGREDIGNSWIYKDKYLEKRQYDEKKGRDRKR